jgi:AcrR family transcriptional regulator
MQDCGRAGDVQARAIEFSMKRTRSRAPAVRRRQSERREQANRRILDAAEGLFAAHGFDGVTLRDVADASKADSALLHYYFTDKAGLFRAVIGRRAHLIDQTRHESLERYEREYGDRMSVEGVLRAYLAPTFELMTQGDKGTLNYGALIAKINATANQGLPLGPQPFDRNVKKMVEMLQRVRPDYAEADVYWFYHLVSGAITLSLARTGRIDALSGGLCSSDDFTTILDRMLRVFSKGFGALEPTAGRAHRRKQPKRAARPRAPARSVK